MQFSPGLGFRRLQAHPFVRQISGMLFLTAAGQGAYILAGPFIGRLYTPSEVGLFGLFVTIWVYSSGASCLMYDYAIPSASDDEEARHLSLLSAVIGLATALALGGSLSLIVYWGLAGLGDFPWWLGPLMAIAIIVQVAVLIAQGWAIRANRVLRIGTANVTMNIIRGLAQVGFGLFLPRWYMMIFGELIARIVQVVQLSQDRIGRIRTWLTRRESFASVARRHREYPVVFGPAFILDSSSQILQTAMIGSLFGAAQMGQFFLMRRTLDLPVAFAFKSLSDLFFAHQLQSAREAPDRIRPFFLKAGLGLLIISCVAIIPLLLFGPRIFEIFYGKDWTVAGQLAVLMAPAMAMNLAVAPVARIFQLSVRPHLRLVPAIFNFAGTLIVLGISTRYNLGLISTTLAMSIAISVQYLAYFVAGYIAAGNLKEVKTDE